VSRTQVDESTATFVLNGAGWAADFAANQSPSYLGTLHVTTTTGDSATITPPAATTCVLILGSARQSGPSAATITVDGTPYATWNLNTGALFADTRYFWFRTLSPPIILTPGTAHTIVVTNSGGSMALDGAEYYIAEAATAGRLTSWGHSWPHGYTLGAPTTQRFGALIAAALGMTEDNQCIDNEDLTNGTLATVAANDVQTIAAVGATAGTFTLPVQAGGSTQTTGSLNWNASAATVLAALQGLSNVGAGQVAVSGTAVNAAGGLVVTFQGALAGQLVFLITPTIGTAFVGASLTVTHTTIGQPVNPQYASQGNNEPGWMFAESGVSVGATWNQKPSLFLALHGINDSGNWNLYDLGNGGSIPAAGIGYSARRFTQRLKEAFWRVKANCPTAELWAMTQPPSLSSDTPANGALFAAINAAIIAAATDPTINANLCDVRNLLGVQNGGAALYTSDHPNATGHVILANAFLDAYRRKHTEKYGQVATVVR
jgi:hypothetical protein